MKVNIKKKFKTFSENLKIKFKSFTGRIKDAFSKENLKRVFSKEGLKQAFTKENIARGIFVALAAFSILAVFGIIFFVLYDSVPAFQSQGFFNFLFGTVWNASTDQYGLLPAIVGTLFLTALAVLLGGILGTFTAVWLVFYCPKKIKGIFTQLINLLAGIPSIIYGLFGYKYLMPLLVNIFGLQNTSSLGEGLMASFLILSVMIIPTVASVTKNSLESVPMHYYEGALALGCSKNQSVWKVLVPAAKSGIISAMLLGLGRAVGETMAVQMLVGGADAFPWGFFTPFSTLTSIIVRDMGYAADLQRSALMGSGFVLLLIILIINLCLTLVRKGKDGNKFFTRKFREGNAGKTQLNFKRTGSFQDVLWILSWIIALLVAFILAFIVVFVMVSGLPHLSVDFLFGQSGNAHITLAPAFVSTILLIILALVIALPLGIGAAIYLNEYAKRGGFFVKTVRLFVDTLAGIPSIVFGLFGMVFLVTSLHMGYSLGAGGIALALMILPTVIRSTEQSLSEVPDSMREASYALGAGKLRTIFKVVLPQALSGIITSVILSVGRIISESAVLIYTAGTGIHMPSGYGSQGASFAVLIYRFMSEGMYWNEAYATASVLLIFVIIINLLVALAEHCFNNKAAGKKGLFAKIKDKVLLKRRRYEEH